MIKRALLIGAAALVGAGLLILFQGTSWALEAAGAALRANGGSMDTSRYNLLLEGYLSNYRLLGIALLGGGLYGFFRTATAGKLV